MFAVSGTKIYMAEPEDGIYKEVRLMRTVDNCVIADVQKSGVENLPKACTIVTLRELIAQLGGDVAEARAPAQPTRKVTARTEVE